MVSKDYFTTNYNSVVYLFYLDSIKKEVYKVYFKFAGVAQG